ncbi:hypothetical protein [Limnoglobus roseus]|uniref:SMI1/KNR4 family protein n=1 Tax=Limnoglobus roseus TaxID=2598579 RepID=A0A5C1AQB0_9BACT|nr:hypothetical protein [Limnoglobus roseus]QEL19364.1 hypothetical protein PX52LOC_06435 [Limnoglobus roseus]
MWPSGTQADQAATEIDDATGEDGDFRPYNAALAAHGAAAPWSDPSGVVSVASPAAFYALRAADPVPESSARGHILADILAGPGLRTRPGPGWRTSTVTALAEGIYRDGAFDRLPILADALEEAGCDRPDILAHCRGDGHHVRGCWVVDLVLAKR